MGRLTVDVYFTSAMLLFLDEAGDAWFKFNKSSSQYFVVWLVVFEDHDDAHACDQRIQSLRNELGLKEDYEFHYKKDSCVLNVHLLKQSHRITFSIYWIVINKSLLRSPNMQIKESFYKYTCSLVFNNARETLDDAIVVIDKQWWKKFEKELQTYIKRKINTTHRKIKKVKMQDSHRNNLLQLADYIASGIYHKVNSTKKSHMIDLLSHREIYVQVRPKK